MTSQRAFRIPKVAAMSNVLAVVIVVLFALPFIVTATTVIDFSMLEDLILAYYSVGYPEFHLITISTTSGHC